MSLVAGSGRFITVADPNVIKSNKTSVEASITLLETSIESTSLE